MPIPGLPLWVGHAVVAPPLNGATHLYLRLHVRRGRWLAWRTGRALAALWHSLYERREPDPIPPAAVAAGPTSRR